MDRRKAEGAIEAILFATGDAVETEKLAGAIEQDTETVRKLLMDMSDEYRKENRGIELTQINESWQLCTKSEYYEYLLRLLKQPKKITLTDVMMETLSIVAYKQPVTKLEIEKIRGVKSDHAINRLIEYNLIRETGRLDAPGRPILFGTTDEFLRHFGLRSLDDLPKMDTIHMEDFKAEAEEEYNEEK